MKNDISRTYTRNVSGFWGLLFPHHAATDHTRHHRERLIPRRPDIASYQFHHFVQRHLPRRLVLCML